ncbi:MAG: response regulator [Gammaproteobacteria bacterium]|nr:response regulator [Gammaproteobacteria bacterium]MDH5303739.1 response regulator [Gammaproteobacteria bacterium]MDH5322269.1 response regulator [Gammaproteobacteria bacterium]
MQILLVEDDQSLADGLCKALRNVGFITNHVRDGKAARHVIEVEPPDIVVLDLGLPDMDGLDVLKSIRANGSTIPVLILTARSSVDARVSGLDLGADDYLPKPFETPELIARLRVIERRLSTVLQSNIHVGNVSLDTIRQQVCLDDVPVELPRREYMVLKQLMENIGKVQTREQLETRLYAWGEEVSSNAIEVHVHHLRKKLGSDLIKTIRGVGYTIRKP